MKNRTFLTFRVFTFLLLLSCFRANQETAADDAIELPEGGGGPGKACLELHWKVMAVLGDKNPPEELRSRADVRKLAQEMLDDRTYLEYTIQGGTLRGNQAILRVVATEGDQMDRGEITMVYDGKTWLYGGSKWTIKVRDVGGQPTMVTMQMIGLSLSFYKNDHDSYPSESSISELAGLLQPKYIQGMKQKDAWNNNLVYRKDPEKNEFWLISYGSDGKPEEGLYDDRGIPIPGRLTPEMTDHIGADIILSGPGSKLLRYPKRW